jgi:GNAT superfamily N-acetyltransferase
MYRAIREAHTPMAAGPGMTAAGSTGTAPTIVEIPLGDPRIKDFVDVHWQLYKGDPFWTPQLNADLLGNKLLGITGLLTPEHEYHKTAEATHFIAYRNGTAVGRVSGVINHRFNDFYNGMYAFFGFFETIDDQAVANALLDAVRDWATSKGAEVLRGPGEYSNATHERQACLIDGFDTPPAIEHTHNPPYYQRLIEEYGFSKAMDYHAYMLDVGEPVAPRLTRVADAVRKRRNLVTRPVDMSRFNEEIRLVIDIYNKAWAENWGFLPMTGYEADALAETLKPIIDPGLIRFAYLNDEPIAVLGCFPDPNVALRPRWKWYGDSDYVRLARVLATRKSIRRMRLIFFGVTPGHRRLGADALLFEEIHAYAHGKGYRECDISLLLEVNDLVIRASEFMGGHRYKTWRIWDLPLTPTNATSG